MQRFLSHCLHLSGFSNMRSFFFKFNVIFFIESLRISHHTPQFCSPSSPVVASPYPCTTLPPKLNNQNKTGKQTNNKTIPLLPHLSHLSNTSFVLVVFGALVFQSILSNQVYLQIFIAMGHWFCSRPLGSGISSSLNLHQNFSWISYSYLKSWRSWDIATQDQSLHEFQ